MNEPKRRGRPTNAERAAKVDAARETDSRIAASYERAVIGTIIAKTPEHAVKAQAYALRVWNGQSVSMPRDWRIERVAAALEGQGLSMEGVELP
jgi:hypothetical protein